MQIPSPVHLMEIYEEEGTTDDYDNNDNCDGDGPLTVKATYQLEKQPMGAKYKDPRSIPFNAVMHAMIDRDKYTVQSMLRSPMGSISVDGLKC